MPRPIENPGSGKGSQPASLAAIAPHQFRSGAEWNGNRNGGRKIGGSVREWWNALSREDGDGKPKYTVAQIKRIADAKDDDKNISAAKRIAARHILEMMGGGRTGREVSAMIFDRTEGKPQQSVHLSGGPEVKTIVLRDERLDPALPDGPMPAGALPEVIDAVTDG